MSDKTDLAAIINIFHFGNSEIEFIPASDVSEIKLMKLAFLYAVKVRFLLETEPFELRKMYEDLFNVIIQPTNWSPVGVIAERLKEVTSSLEMQDEDLPDSGTDERFLITLAEGEETDYVVTEIPLPGLAVNIPVSAFILSNAVASRLSLKNLEIFENQLSTFMRMTFDIKEFQLTDLKKINKSITMTMKFAAEIANFF